MHRRNVKEDRSDVLTELLECLKMRSGTELRGAYVGAEKWRLRMELRNFFGDEESGEQCSQFFESESRELCQLAPFVKTP